MASTRTSPSARTNPTRRLFAAALALGLALVVVTWTAAPPRRVAHGVLPSTAARVANAAGALATSAGRDATASTTTTTTTTTGPIAAVAPVPPEDTTLHTPEDVPDPSVRRPIQLIGRIRIPAIGVDRELRDQITQESIDLGPSHWPGTAMPGAFGNAVVAGHRNSHGAPFHDLGGLHVGDQIVLGDQLGHAFTYSVTEMFVVNPDAMWITEQQPGHTLTLFTCHPIGSSAQRLVVRATLV